MKQKQMPNNGKVINNIDVFTDIPWRRDVALVCFLKNYYVGHSCTKVSSFLQSPHIPLKKHLRHKIVEHESPFLSIIQIVLGDQRRFGPLVWKHHSLHLYLEEQYLQRIAIWTIYWPTIDINYYILQQSLIGLLQKNQ